MTLMHTATSAIRRTIMRLLTGKRSRAFAARRVDLTMPTRLHNALFVLFIGGILVYGAGFACYLLARFDLVNLLRDVNADDSFFYFQIAWNMAEGKFSTFDGGISRTNGYHPIWMLLVTPFYWVFDKEAALFAIKAFEIMLVAGGVAAIAMAARLARLPWVLLFAALPALYRSHGAWVGMEASAGLFMLGLLFLALCLYARNPARWRWALATVVFALPWVRLEYIAISLVATGALCVIEWSWRERAPGASRREQVRSVLAADAVIPLLGALAGILVYFAYNWLVFGGILPVSGVTKHLWSQVWWEREGGYSLPRNLLNIMEIPVFSGGALAVMLATCAFLPLLWWLVRRAHRRDDWLLLVFLVGVFGVAAGHLAKFAQTVLVVHPVVASSGWYFVPAYLTLALFIPVGCYVAVRLVLLFVSPKTRRAAVFLSRGIIGVGAAVLFVKTDFTYPFQYVDDASHSNRTELEVSAYMSAQVMNRILPEGSVVGSWDAGVIGYFSRFPVVNLDGLVNSYEYLRGYRDAGRETGWTYIGRHANAEPLLQKFGITHFANPLYPDKKVDTLMYESASFTGPRMKEMSIRIWSSAPLGDFDAAAWFWEKLEPHFDYRSGDAGLIVDGRTAQAFARKCPSDEEILWFWNGSEGKAFIDPSRRWRNTQTGLCVATAVLPHNSDTPMRLEAMTASDYLAELVRVHQPVIRSNYDVYLVDDSLLYVKEQCKAADTEARFFLHVMPARRLVLSVRRWPYGYDNLDFDFKDRGVVFDGKCMAVRDAPDYAIAGIRTGQYTSEGRVWESRHPPVVRAAEYAAVVAGEALIRSEWDLYRHEGRLYYVKEQCEAADTESPFFLHVIPARRFDLSVWRWSYDHDNLDFDFNDQGIAFDGKCMAVHDVPDYAIAAIRTGQYTAAGRVWESRHPPVVRAAEYAAVVAGEALIRSEWDVYRHEGRLYYVKEQCEAADTEAPFFLHLSPARRFDLSVRRWLYGYDNLDFDFKDRGVVFDGKCMAARDAPDYAIAGIRTGQYTGSGRIWQGEYQRDASP